MPEECPMHETTNKDIQEISNKVSKHQGMWVVVLLILGISLAWIGSSVRDIKNDSGKTTDAVIRVDKTFSSYIAAATQQLSEINKRLDRYERDNADHETRIRTLESH